MKKYTLLCIISFAFSFAVNAAAPSINFESVVGNKYLAFGSGGVLSQEDVSQTSLGATWDNGIAASIWMSRPIRSGVPKTDFSREVDYTLGWSGKRDYWSLSASVTYFDEPKVGSHGPGDIWYTSLKASHGMGYVNFDLSYETYSPRTGSGYEGGHLLGVGISKKLEFQERLFASFGTKLRYDDGGFGFDKGYLLSIDAELSWKLTRNLSVILPRVYAYVPLTVRDARKTDAMAFAGVSINL